MTLHTDSTPTLDQAALSASCFKTLPAAKAAADAEVDKAQQSLKNAREQSQTKDEVEAVLAEVFGVAFVMEQDIPANPLRVSILGADAVMPVTANIANAVQKFGLAGVERSC